VGVVSSHVQAGEPNHRERVLGSWKVDWAASRPQREGVEALLVFVGVNGVVELDRCLSHNALRLQLQLALEEGDERDGLGHLRWGDEVKSCSEIVQASAAEPM